jgi:hypothetical protein
VKGLQPPEPEGDEFGDPEAQGGYADSPPLLVVATEPTELISSNGDPEFTPLSETGLLYLANTDSFVFMELETQRFYILVSGRWFRSGSLENGPWLYVPADELPAGFASIPSDSDVGAVLASVAGTDEALDAVMDAQIPQTAAVSTSATIEVEYDGDPVFEPIESTDMTYATNTEYQIVEVDGHFYLCHAATWFESASATGTFRVATSIPDEIYSIPPESPVFNVRYVHIYESKTDTVYVGYTAGYTGGYVYGPTVVYGTGYYYYPWYGAYYYPRPVTYGFAVHYNPWTGWSFGFSIGYGPFHFGIGTGGWYRGGFWGAGAYWAGRRHGAYHGYRAGFRAGYRAGQRDRNMYRPTPYARTQARDRARDIPANRPGAGTRPSTGARDAAAARPGTANNVLADRNGNVYRRNEAGGFDQRDRGSWQSRPSTSSAGSQLQRTQQSRDRGTSRTQNFSSGRARSGARAGGARRRPID